MEFSFTYGVDKGAPEKDEREVAGYAFATVYADGEVEVEIDTHPDAIITLFRAAHEMTGDLMDLVEET